MKLGQLMKYNKINFFSSKIMERKNAARLVPDLFLFFEKALYEVKLSGLHISFNVIRNFA